PLAPRPSSTPFPYTTLFRSRRHPARVREQGQEGQGRPLPAPHRHVLRRGLAPQRGGHRVVDRRRQDGHVREERGDVEGRRPLREDRKSTRLNSSHDQISYAV